jgi:hypothetical protein
MQLCKHVVTESRAPVCVRALVIQAEVEEQNKGDEHFKDRHPQESRASLRN